MKGQKHIVGILFSSFLIFCTPVPVSAEAVQVMPVPVTQRFTPAEAGDTGLYNCMVAALSSSLQTLILEKKIAPATNSTYTSLRRQLRRTVPPDRGIPPHTLIEETSFLTNGQVSLSMQQISEILWEEMLITELEKGYPVIVHISDRELLYSIKPPEDSSHVIVVYGIDDNHVYFADSWDGKTHHISKERFSTAWKSGLYPWWIFTFTVKEKESSFAAILRDYSSSPIR